MKAEISRKLSETQLQASQRPNLPTEMGATNVATGDSGAVALGAAIGIIAGVVAIIGVLIVIKRKRKQRKEPGTTRTAWSERLLTKMENSWAPMSASRQQKDEERSIEMDWKPRPVHDLPLLPVPPPGPSRQYRRARLSSIPENPFVIAE